MNLYRIAQCLYPGGESCTPEDDDLDGTLWVCDCSTLAELTDQQILDLYVQRVGERVQVPIENGRAVGEIFGQSAGRNPGDGGEPGGADALF